VATGGEATSARVDVRRRDDLRDLVGLACEGHGRLDVLVSNAGIGPISPLDDLRVDEWEQMIDINLKGVLYGIAAAFPVFREQGFGHFVDVSSSAAHRIVPNQSVYAATKTASGRCRGGRSHRPPDGAELIPVTATPHDRSDEMSAANQRIERPGGSALLAGRPVARIGFGAMQLPGPGVWGPPRNRDTALAVLRRAVELGANHIDTAQFYGPDVANELIHAALHPYPEDLVLVSKVGAARGADGGWTPSQRPDQLRAGVEANLRSLAVEQLDVVNLRLHDAEDGEETAGHGVDLDSQLAEMVALRDEGKIRGIGISNVTPDQLRQALPAGIACVQNPYSVLDRSGEPVLDLCREHDVAWVPFFPLGSAFPGVPKVTEHPAVVAAATALGATPAQVGLAWLLAHDPHVLLIPGTSSLEHLAENMATANVHLDADTKTVLDGLAAPVS
jgi:pyridoxine 4-dehydrogenase